MVVQGYQGEPYLRFVPGDGVYENTLSPSTYLNQQRYGNVEVSREADPAAGPQWRRVSTTDGFVWHDHRVHWMAATDPPAVASEASDPDRDHTILAWEVPIVIGQGAAVEVVGERGDLRWVPSVPWWPPVLTTAVVALGAVAVTALVTRPRAGRWPGPARAATGLIWVVLAANTVRTIDDLLAVPASLADDLLLVVVTAVVIAAVLGLTRRSWRGHPGGFVALFAAGVPDRDAPGWGGIAADQRVTGRHGAPGLDPALDDRLHLHRRPRVLPCRRARGAVARPDVDAHASGDRGVVTPRRVGGSGGCSRPLVSTNPRAAAPTDMGPKSLVVDEPTCVDLAGGRAFGADGDRVDQHATTTADGGLRARVRADATSPRTGTAARPAVSGGLHVISRTYLFDVQMQVASKRVGTRSRFDGAHGDAV